ncbi:MAG: Coq4 family protein, partial [Alphaproteobacteria bacterium]
HRAERAHPVHEHVEAAAARVLIGRSLLAEKPQILDVLQDSDRLAAMPLGSLGRTYYEFTKREQITADGLVEASDVKRVEAPKSVDGEWMSKRMRDVHDLWHVLSGYGRDGLGELCLLGFSYAQTKARGIGFIAAMGAIQARKWGPDGGKLPSIKAVWEGYRLGKKAAWLPAVEFEKLMERNVIELRRELNIGEHKTYDDVLVAFNAPAPIPV